jgi:hypothetical protein
MRGTRVSVPSTGTDNCEVSTKVTSAKRKVPQAILETGSAQRRFAKMTRNKTWQVGLYEATFTTSKHNSTHKWHEKKPNHS